MPLFIFRTPQNPTRYLIEQKKTAKNQIWYAQNRCGILLGHSLITPTFQKNRWDYVFTYQVGEGPILVKRAAYF